MKIETIMAVPMAIAAIIGETLKECLISYGQGLENYNQENIEKELTEAWEKELEYKYEEEVQELLEQYHLSHIWNTKYDSLQKCKEALIKNNVKNNYRPW